MRRRRRRRGRSTTRRRLLLAAGAAVGGGALLSGSEAYTSAVLSRASGFGVSADDSAVVGLYVYSSVEWNNRDPMVDVTNNAGRPLDVTVSLDTCSDGTVYLAGSSGCSATATNVGAGNSVTAELDADVYGQDVPFTVTATGDGFEATIGRSIASSFFSQDPIAISKLKNLQANAGRDEFTVGLIQVRDQDGDDDVETVTYYVFDSSFTLVTSRQDTPGGVGKYQQSNLTIPTSIDVRSNDTYYLYVVAEDADGNTDTAFRSF